MFKNLSPRAIGIRDLPLEGTVALAAAHGFAGIDLDIREAAALARARGLDHVRRLFADAGVRPGQWGLPVAWRDDARWRADLAELPELAALGVALGCARTSTFMPSGSDERPYAENFAWHVERFRPIAETLREQGCRLGIEFLGPQTLRARFRHEFIHTLDALLELRDAIGAGNVGVLLDAWHLYTAGAPRPMSRGWTRATWSWSTSTTPPAGIPRDAQIDSVRELPLATRGDRSARLHGRAARAGLRRPVTVEPFNQALNEVARDDPDQAARLVSQSLDRLWQAADLR